MSKEEQIDEILSELEKTGSRIDYLKELRAKSLEFIKYQDDFQNVMNRIVCDIKEKSESFLDAKN